MVGNSVAGNVASVKRLRPAFKATRSPFCFSSIFAPSGSAHDVEQFARWDGDFAIDQFVGVGRSDHFDFEVGAGERELAVAHFDQKVGEYRQRLATFDYSDDLLQGFKQSFSLDAELHVCAFPILQFCF
jgi:hypothetical protein